MFYQYFLNQKGQAEFAEYLQKMGFAATIELSTKHSARVLSSGCFSSINLFINDCGTMVLENVKIEFIDLTSCQACF